MELWNSHTQTPAPELVSASEPALTQGHEQVDTLLDTAQTLPGTISILCIW